MPAKAPPSGAKLLTGRTGRKGPTPGAKPRLGPTLETTAKQNEFLDAVFSGKYKYLAFGGGIRGTKTWTGLIALITLMRIYPGSRWAVVRKDLPTLRRNTIPSINKIRYTVNNFLGEINQSTWTYTAKNGSELIVFPESFATDSDLDRWKGLEVNGFLLEEANELVEKAFGKAVERAGSWIIPATDENPDPVQPPILVLLTFNPAGNWVKTKFYDPWRAGTIRSPFYFLPATIMDNPYASEDYKESLKNLDDRDYKRFVQGEWEGNDDPDQLIKAEWVWGGRFVESIPGPNSLGVDVARYGDDKSCFCLMMGNRMAFLHSIKGLSLDRVATTAAAFAGDVNHLVAPRDIKVDAIGLGAGVVDIMKKAGFGVTELKSGHNPVYRPNTLYRFKNLRSQMWFEAKEKLRLGLISLPDDVPLELVADLTAPRYEILADKTIYVESKDDIKQRLGRSTDFGDAFVYSIFDVPAIADLPPMPPSLSRVTLR